MFLTLTTQISLTTEGVIYYVGLTGMTTNFGFVVIMVAQPAGVLLTLAPIPWDRMKGLSRESTRYDSGGYRLLECMQCLSLRFLSV